MRNATGPVSSILPRPFGVCDNKLFPLLRPAAPLAATILRVSEALFDRPEDCPEQRSSPRSHPRHKWPGEIRVASRLSYSRSFHLGMCGSLECSLFFPLLLVVGARLSRFLHRPTARLIDLLHSAGFPSERLAQASLPPPSSAKLLSLCRLM